DRFEVGTSRHEMSTAMPRNRLSKQMSAGATQATDPQEPTFFVRYGGDTTSDPDVVSSLAAYERDFPARNPGYTKLRLDPGTHHGVTAVDWKFEYDSPEGRRRVGVHSCKLGCEQYSVYAYGLTGRWRATPSLTTPTH